MKLKLLTQTLYLQDKSKVFLINFSRFLNFKLFHLIEKFLLNQRKYNLKLKR